MKTAKNLSKFKNIRHGFCDKNDSKEVKKTLLLTQIHSFEILNPELIEKPYDQPEGDGWVTDKKGYCLTVKSADCAPVLMTDGNIIAAIHAGWKGALTGVLEQAILKMLQLGSHIENICVAIGPCLQKQSFIVQPDMQSLFSKNMDVFFSQTNGQTHFDFSGYVRYRLNSAGINNICTVNIDTFTDKNYNSYRREPENPARQYSFIAKIG